jgi:hypothetical protein
MSGVRHVQLPTAFAPAVSRAGNLAKAQRGGHFSQKAKASAQEPSGVSAETAERANAFLDRESLLDRAVHAGVVNQGMRAHYAAAYDADPAGCRAYLGKLGLRDEDATALSAPAPEAKPSRLVNLGG